jgi:hypothetical protein
MARLCERPACSEPAAVAYGFDAANAFMWLGPLSDAPQHVRGVLCKRHADAMVVPRGWSLDDRREPTPRLFRPPGADPTPVHALRPRRPRHPTEAEQLVLGADPPSAAALPGPEPAGAIEHVHTVESLAADEPAVTVAELVAEGAPGAGTADPDATVAMPWRPDFDVADDLGGLLEARGPLLSRAFRGTDRPER